MKYLTLPIFILTLLLQGCYLEGPGPEGPRGPRGFDGLDGVDGEEAFVFEYQFDFEYPDYRQLFLLPSTFQMLDSDVVLVYFLWEVTDDGTEVWRSIPQSLITSEGLLQYNYDFTKFDVSVFMEAAFPPDILGSDFLDNWIARVVVVPGQFSSGRTSAMMDYDEVKLYYNLPETKLDLTNYTNRPPITSSN